MTGDAPREVTKLLNDYAAGDKEAMNRLFHLVYDELRRTAERKILDSDTLQPTEVVHEAYMDLFMSKNFAKNLVGKHRCYFFGAATKAMTRILVKRAKERKNRGGGKNPVAIDIVLDNLQQTQRLDIVDLHEALEQLKQLDSRKHEVVMMRFFGGQAMKEIADDLDVCLATVEKDWHFARAWLKRKLEADK